MILPVILTICVLLLPVFTPACVPIDSGLFPRVAAWYKSLYNHPQRDIERPQTNQEDG
ncbi:hypothetical protein BJX65DRAFT_287510 [Aspergillus insuetus]